MTTIYEVSVIGRNGEWISSKFNTFDEMYDHIVKGRDYGDIFVNNEIILPLTKDAVENKLVIGYPNNVLYKTYAWDDDNSKITMVESYRIRIYEDDKKPVSYIKAAEVKKMLSSLNDNDDVVFYSGYYNMEFYPVNIKKAGNKVSVELNRSDIQF